ncbi:uncharacterized protein Dwil_GK25143, isoform C [Drosophila willistoni]|nr:DNA translocase FtsK 1 isoform X2 [Drosophila willistoni]KRF99611.1 uncharacterized protein Dwil_GK25143, isoform C [Drosophila willistoni]
MFNNQATQHKQSQLLNPFSQDGRASSPKPSFSKDQYGKPLAGSLTEMRGQKANIHVMKEMLELCQIINSEGYDVKDEPTMRVIPFGELFNIYNYISDKVVGILLRARKHKLVDFEGEMLYQRRDDDVPVFLLKPIKEIRKEMDAKIEDIKRAASPAPPQSTSVLLDRSAHEQNLKVQQEQQRLSKSRTPSPAVKSKNKSKSPSPAGTSAAGITATTTGGSGSGEGKPPVAPATVAPAPSPTPTTVIVATEETTPSAEPTPEFPPVVADSAPIPVNEAKTEQSPNPEPQVEQTPVAEPQSEAKPEAASLPNPSPTSAPEQVSEAQTSAELPTIVIEASAVFVRTVSVDPESSPASNPDTTTAPVPADSA